ncbi:hypothetical protein RDMS_10505 [Deinococcus sp. RL]|uniref:hypothetical protein n=1 Tax=Deinococcus sp. RL TaxID=1489678 RepID=UPI0004DA09D3|nr:hypothetical protein [Deinococcus sp. RL]KEF33789.1 hypothetical protein RDMS_10505 [Deinococcus sp. RL]
MLRVALWLTALVFVPVGLFLYFLPPGVAGLLGVSPLWLARASGGLVLAWGVLLLAASRRPDPLGAGALAGGNLLLVAALVPALLRLGDTLDPSLRLVLLGLSAALGVLAMLGLLNWPSPPRRERGEAGGERA